MIPEIQSTEFGKITVDEKIYEHDIVIRLCARLGFWWRLRRRRGRCDRGSQGCRQQRLPSLSMRVGHGVESAAG